MSLRVGECDLHLDELWYSELRLTTATDRKSVRASPALRLSLSLSLTLSPATFFGKLAESAHWPLPLLLRSRHAET